MHAGQNVRTGFSDDDEAVKELALRPRMTTQSSPAPSMSVGTLIAGGASASSRVCRYRANPTRMFIAICRKIERVGVVERGLLRIVRQHPGLHVTLHVAESDELSA